MALSVLVVDDSKIMRNMVKKVLGLSGFPIERVDDATDGMDALEKVGQGEYDLLLVDINMPRMNGMELLEKLRESESTKKLPVVMVSTEGSKLRIARLRELGASFVHKPFTPPDLVDAMIEVIGGIDVGMGGSPEAGDGDDF